MVLGITGGIASGKSTVSEMFRRQGATVVSADQLARDVVHPGSPILARLAERFGGQILNADGSLQREALARIVFSDEEGRKDLNAITHPAIAELAERRLAELRSRGERLIVYEAPLLFEAGAEGRADRVLVVWVEPRVQLQRLMARDGLDEAEARNRIATQIPLAEKAARADFVIDNSGTPAATQDQVTLLFSRLSEEPFQPPGRR